MALGSIKKLSLGSHSSTAASSSGWIYEEDSQRSDLITALFDCIAAITARSIHGFALIAYHLEYVFDV